MTSSLPPPYRWFLIGWTHGLSRQTRRGIRNDSKIVSFPSHFAPPLHLRLFLLHRVNPALQCHLHTTQNPYIPPVPTETPISSLGEPLTQIRVLQHQLTLPRTMHSHRAHTLIDQTLLILRPPMDRPHPSAVSRLPSHLIPRLLEHLIWVPSHYPNSTLTRLLLKLLICPLFHCRVVSSSAPQLHLTLLN